MRPHSIHGKLSGSAGRMPFLIRFALFAALALSLGLGSAWRALNHGFFATTQRFGPWALWSREAAVDSDPYSIARVARQGVLPLTSSAAVSFTATRDSAGSRLSGSCTYEVRGLSVAALWWNVSVFKSDGTPMETKAARSGFSSETATLTPDGSFMIRISPEPQPGNWIPSAPSARFVIAYMILKPLNPEAVLEAAQSVLPEISLAACS